MQTSVTRAELLALSEDMRRQLSLALAPDHEIVPFLKRTKVSTLKKLSLTRRESLQRLEELASWLHVYDRDDEAQAVGRALLVFPFQGDYTQYGPVESVLALTAWLAEQSDAELADTCRAHIVGAYGRREDWSDRRRSAMANRLGGWQVEWQERNRANHDLNYALAQLGELAFLAIWSGSGTWPMARIRQEFADKTAHLRRLKKI
ncbi:DUF6707 family protein [Planotetraspora kaengkrachanensis]|uniref:Uncharacterized protein n=1 Tax=Planotetraspora kaengkrachanensis TaxID=575193 RepID=A0A8J3M9B3_9ACTN|nr:DUF6707 family protein [Planotetraspora kaengkrachanensis]GIG80565.1 hypothetical protein Pka01_36920 [Planotetraspora kaengkrachanensis]